MRSLFGRTTAIAATAAVLLAAPAAATTRDNMRDGQSAKHYQAHSEDHQQPMPTSPVAYEFGETLANLQGSELEITFLAEIIPHHASAIAMSELELERGTSEQIRTHAENIIANQQHQIDQFTRWLEQWYGLTPEDAMAEVSEEARHEMAAMEREMEDMIAELREVPAGPQFDVAFVEQMIPHHQEGIIEFLEPQSRAPHVQLRVAASDGINTQSAEVADFRTWLSEHAKHRDVK